jgi:hypothetical protein
MLTYVQRPNKRHLEPPPLVQLSSVLHKVYLCPAFSLQPAVFASGVPQFFNPRCCILCVFIGSQILGGEDGHKLTLY